MPELSFRQYYVYHAKSGGELAVERVLNCTTVRDYAAPKIGIAKFEVNTAWDNFHAWQWKDKFAFGDRIVVMAQPAGELDADVIFDGHIAEIHWQLGNSENLNIVATSLAARLARDSEYMIIGRYMQSEENIRSLAEGGGEEPVIETQLYNGVPCVFNADNNPNRSAEPTADGVYFFVGDDAPTAERWTVDQAVRYLLKYYDASGYVQLPGQKDEEGEAVSLYDIPEETLTLRNLSVEAKSLWAALGAIAEFAAWTVSITHAYDETLTSYLEVNDGSEEYELYHPELDLENMPGDKELEKFNAFNISVTESASSCVTTPTVAAAADHYELAVELMPAWPDSDDFDSEVDIIEPGYEKAEADSDWVKKYCDGGSDFKKDTGRKWDANTDGYYSDETDNIPDLAELCGLEALSWPRMAHQPRRLLGAARDARQAIVQYSVDSGTTWYPIESGCRIGSRLGVYLTVRNLASICQADEDPTTDSLAAKLIADKTTCKLRLVCTVAAPTRRIKTPEATMAAGDAFNTSRVVNAGDMFAAKVRSNTVATGPAADELSVLNAETQLYDYAEHLQALNEHRQIEAQVTTENITSTAKIGMSIPRINGIDYELTTGRAGAQISPRIIAREFCIGKPTDFAYQTTLVLDGFREQAII